MLAGVDPLDSEALELLTYVRRKHREVPVILLFPRLHPERAKEALRLGAMAVLKYPVPAAELRAAVLQALELCEARGAESAVSPPFTPSPVNHHPADALTLLQSEPALSADTSPPAALRRSVPGGDGAANSSVLSGSRVLPPTTAREPQRVELVAREVGLIGTDPSWRQVIELAAMIAATRTSVLIVGEPGTGKSLLARLIHSARAQAGAALHHGRSVVHGRQTIQSGITGLVEFRHAGK